MASWWQVLLSGLLGSIVGGVLTASVVVWQQQRQDRNAGLQAFRALRFEFEHVLETKGASEHLGVLLVPTDAYRASLPHIGALPDSDRSVILDAGIAVAAYNRNAEAVNRLDEPADPGRYSGVKVMLLLACGLCSTAIESLDRIPGI